MKTFKTKAGTELQLLNLRGKDYLEVKYRLVWFREERPDFSIETEIIDRQDDVTVAKAVIKDPAGRVLAMAHKREDQKGFPDHMEKAETGAIGRALALLGYGTQFCADELDEGERIVDAPADPAKKAGVKPPAGKPTSGPKPKVELAKKDSVTKLIKSFQGWGITEKQMLSLVERERSVDITQDDLEALIKVGFEIKNKKVTKLELFGDGK